MKEKLKMTESMKNGGITLIALVVTIVVLLILAGITINMLFSENGIITKSKQAAEETAKAEENEVAGMQGIADEIDKIIASGSNNETINPYDPDGWVKAWTCTDGTWSDEISAGTTISDDVDVVAKLYETGNKITPPKINLYINGISKTEYEFVEGEEYKLVLEGEGEMGALMNSTSGEAPTEAYAWQYSALLFLGGYSDTCIIPYITEIIVCDGITNIGAYAFIAGASLKELKIGNTVKNIERYVASTCVSLEKVTIPNSITNIEKRAFEHCKKLTNVVIPNNVVSVGDNAFFACLNLIKIKILVTDADKLSINNGAFYFKAENSIIYVLSENIKTKIEGTYETTNTTVQVVTKEQMDNI